MPKQLIIALLAAITLVQATKAGELKRVGPIWGRSFIAKNDASRACFYGTVTSSRTDRLLGDPTIFFGRIDQKANSAKFEAVAWPNKDTLQLADQMGDVIEACVGPGDYQIYAIAFSWGVYGQGAYHSNVFRHQDKAFRLEAGKDYYLGNIYIPGTNMDFQVENRLERDSGLIARLAKAPPRGTLTPIEFFRAPGIK
jgi:hypothetical protein